MKDKKTYLDNCRKQNIHYFDKECPNCGWGAISEAGLEEGYCEIIDGKVKCTCPICSEEFEYFDDSR